MAKIGLVFKARHRMKYSQVGKRILFSHDIVSNLTAWKIKRQEGSGSGSGLEGEEKQAS